jgi:hypothetical protein
VWASDFSTREGAGDWIDWRLLPKMLAQVARGLSLQHSWRLRKMEVRQSPSVGGVCVKTTVRDAIADQPAVDRGSAGYERLQALVAEPQGTIKTIDFDRLAPGEFRAFVPLATTASVARTTLKYTRGDGSGGAMTVGLALPYDNEISLHGIEPFFFSALPSEPAHVCSLESVAESVLGPRRGVEPADVTTGGFLLAAAPFLLLLELVVRRR